MDDGVRIQKALADAGVGSRRAAEQLVADGRVTVNGARAAIGQRVRPEVDVVAVDGRPMPGPQTPLYLVMSKPAGVTSTVSDRHAARTVLDLVPAGMRRGAERLYPVGRLDRDSEGLLLLTNDGGWAQRLLHPRHAVEREYAVAVSRSLDRDQVAALRAGIDLEEGAARLRSLRPATEPETRTLEAAVGPPVRSFAWYRAVLTQGRRRQIRRMFAAADAPVERLVRVRIGRLELRDLALGDVRPLDPEERRSLGDDAGGPTREAAPQRGLVVSLDGPASSGKSSVGAAAALRLGYRFCDTGLLYRGLTWLALERGVAPDDEAGLVALVPDVALAQDAVGRLDRLVVGGDDVTDRLHGSGVERYVSEVARQPGVRAALLARQRDIAAPGRIIMAGRDIGTVVLPDADLKLYIDVSLEERATRRMAERGVEPGTPAAGDLTDEIRRRDGIDASRPVAPLRVPEGAVVISTGGNTLEETVDEVVRTIREHEAARA